MLLLLMHNKIGNKWSQLTNFLKGRTDNTIKNHWNSTMKKRFNFVNENLKNKLVEIKNRFNEHDLLKIEKLLIDELIEIISTQMKKINADKKIAYENFKNFEGENENSLKTFKLRKILGHGTHSKKRIKKGKSSKKKKIHKKISKFCQNEINLTADISKTNNIFNNNFNFVNYNLIDKNELSEINANFYNGNSHLPMNVNNCNLNYINKYNNTINNSLNTPLNSSFSYNQTLSTDSTSSAFHKMSNDNNIKENNFFYGQKFTPVQIISFSRGNSSEKKKDVEKDVNKNIKNNKKNLTTVFDEIGNKELNVCNLK